MEAIIKRNLKLYFRDRAGVFYSMLGVIIIIGLYALFLGNLMLTDMGDTPGARFLMDSWIMAGMLAASTMTTTLGALGVMVEDRHNKLLKDFSAAPIKRSSLTASYVISACLTGFIMSLFTLLLAEIFIVIYGGQLLPILALLKLLGVMMLSVLASGAIVAFIVSFIKSLNAFAGLSTIVGTMIGFLTGIYVPIGSLPVPMQWVIRLFPISHASSLMRQIMMEVPIAEAMGGAPRAVLDEFNRTLGVVFFFDDKVVTPAVSILVLAITAVVFFGLSTLSFSRKAK